MMRRLSHLLAELPESRLLGSGDPLIAAIRYDSRTVRPGDLFVAIPGAQSDGHLYLRAAAEQGAAAVAVQEDRSDVWTALPESTLIVALPDTRLSLSRLAAAFYEHPARRLWIIGITGTDGKTSLSHLVAHVLKGCGERSGLITTIGGEIDGQPLSEFDSRFTTPEAPEVQAMLSRILTAGCRHAIIESTSHGLAQQRLADCEYDIAVVTNVGSDHLDFHGSREEYIAAKTKLFQQLDTSIEKGIEKTAVINADDPASAIFARATKRRKLTYALESPADFTAANLQIGDWHSEFTLQTPGGNAAVRLPQPGRFSVYNALAAAAIGAALDLPLGQVVAALESWPGAPGRMERIAAGQPFAVVVDFAHAPESLARVLSFLRERTAGRLIAVFGCIGERDKERRLPMGLASGRLADYTIVTDDNPYTEEREQILAVIAAGLRAAGRSDGSDYGVTPDRREAIAQALTMAGPGDTVLLAGKGHEQTVYLRDSSYECDDRRLAAEILGGLYPGGNRT